MREFPTPYVGWLHRYQAGVTGPTGRPIDAWVPAKTDPGTPFKYIQAIPIDMRDVETGRPFALVELYLPPRLVTQDDAGEWTVPLDDPLPKDVIDLADANPFGIARFEVQGWVKDYTKGFHGWEAGKVLNLQRA